MKTHTIKTPTAELLILELPEGWIFNAYKDQIGFCNEINKPITQIKGYTLLGKPDEIREEDVMELVESWESVAEDGTKVFENYLTDVPKKRTAKESLLSLIETEIHWDVNPLGNRNPANDPDFPYLADAQQSRIKEWQEAEQKTFDRNRTLIFFKLLSN